MKLSSCRQISTMTANAHWTGSGAFHSAFLFRSRTLSLPINWAKVCSSSGFPTVSTIELTGVQKQSEAALLHVCVERFVTDVCARSASELHRTVYTFEK